MTEEEFMEELSNLCGQPDHISRSEFLNLFKKGREIASHFTDAELAKDFGVSVPTIGYWLTGDTCPGLLGRSLYLRKLSRFVRIHPNLKEFHECVEFPEETKAKLLKIENKLALKYGVPAKDIREFLIKNIKEQNLIEDDLLQDWLSIYSAVLEDKEEEENGSIRNK